MQAKIIKKQISVWITTDERKHLSAEQAIEHQKKVSARAVLTNFFESVDMSSMFAERGNFMPAIQIAEELVIENWSDILRFNEAMNSALNPEEEGKS